MSWPDRPNRDARFDTEHVLLAGQTATLRPFKGAKLAFPCLGVENFLSPTTSSTGKSGPFLLFEHAVSQLSVLAET